MLCGGDMAAGVSTAPSHGASTRAVRADKRVTPEPSCAPRVRALLVRSIANREARVSSFEISQRRQSAVTIHARPVSSVVSAAQRSAMHPARPVTKRKAM